MGHGYPTFFGKVGKSKRLNIDDLILRGRCDVSSQGRVTTLSGLDSSKVVLAARSEAILKQHVFYSQLAVKIYINVTSQPVTQFLIAYNYIHLKKIQSSNQTINKQTKYIIHKKTPVSPNEILRIIIKY